MALLESYLAHDGQRLFDHTGPMFFPKAATPFPFIVRGTMRNEGPFDLSDALDAVAMIHLLQLPVIEPERLKAALGHLESMIGLSRESWRYVLAETDNDHEWVPNPRQQSVLPGRTINEEMVKVWMTFLDESEAIFEGKKLIPFCAAGMSAASTCAASSPNPGPSTSSSGPGHRRSPLPGKGPPDQAGDLAKASERVPRRVHRICLVV